MLRLVWYVSCSCCPCNTRYKESYPATPEVAWSRVGRGGTAPTAPAITLWCCDFRPATHREYQDKPPARNIYFGRVIFEDDKDHDFLFPMVKTSLLLFLCLRLFSTLVGSSAAKLMMAALPPTQARTCQNFTNSLT